VKLFWIGTIPTYVITVPEGYSRTERFSCSRSSKVIWNYVAKMAILIECDQ